MYTKLQTKITKKKKLQTKIHRHIYVYVCMIVFVRTLHILVAP